MIDWVDIRRVLCAGITAKLDAKEYQRLDWVVDASDGNTFDPEQDVEDVRLLTGQALVTYGQLRRVSAASAICLFHPILRNHWFDEPPI